MASKSPAHTLSDFLSASGLGNIAPGTKNWRITTGRQSDDPNQLITLYDSGGLADNPRWRLNYPSVQVRVRGAVDDYSGTWSKANDLKEFLVGLEPQDINGDRYSGIILISGLNAIGYDKISRPEFTFNLRIFLEPAADSSSEMHRDSL